MEHFGTVGTLWNVWNTFALFCVTQIEFHLFLDMIVHIPVYLTLANKLYLSSKINIDPLLISTKNIYGLFIYNCLNKGTGLKQPEDIRVDPKYSQTVTLEIPELIFYTKGIHFTNRANHSLNLFIKRLMLEDFHGYMDFHYKLNRTPLRQAIWDWMFKSNLYEDAIALRTLEKNYERYRKSDDSSSFPKRIFA